MIKFNPFAQRSSGNVTPIPTVYSNYGMSISPEKAEEASYKLVATKYVNAANNANVNIGDTVNNVLSKIKENPALKSDYERYTKFLNTEVQKINKANQAVDQLKKIANDEYSKVLDEMNKTGNYDEKKLTSIESSLNGTIKTLMGNSDKNWIQAMGSGPDILDTRITQNEMFKSNKMFSNNLRSYLESADKALTNIESFKNSTSPLTLIVNWEKKPNAAYNSKGQKSENMITRFTLNPEKVVDSSPYISKAAEEVDKRAPESEQRMTFLSIIKEHKSNGYGEIPTKKINERMFDNGSEVLMLTMTDTGVSMMKIDKQTGEYLAYNLKDGAFVNTGAGKTSEQGFKGLAGDNLSLINSQIETNYVPTEEALSPAAEEAEIKAIEEAPKTAQKATTQTSATNNAGQGGYASPAAKSSPSAKSFFRVKNPNGGPDKLYDATTNKLIADEAEFKTGYTKEIEMPKTVKAIYRDGAKIYDYHTGQHITDPAILGSQYKVAIEVAKQKTDDDYFNEMKAEIGGERADGQPGYNDDQIKEIAGRYKEGKYGSAREAYADILAKQGKTEIETEEKAKRKFSKILKNDDGTIKVDENGRPIKEDFYFPIYTPEELEKLSDEQKSQIELASKEAYLKAGGKEETWNSSQEKAALTDTLTNPASKDEMSRAADLKARDTMEKAKNPGKETTYRNPYGKSAYNVSEDTLVGSEDKKAETVLPTKTDDPTATTETTGSTSNTGTAVNPWAANANAPKEKEFIKVDNTNLDKKVLSYRKSTNKEKLSGAE